MHTLSRHTLLFAIMLAGLAGCVDAIAFMQLGGFFVSFMSGNSTRLAVSLQREDWEVAVMLLSIIGCFVLGAVVGATVSHRFKVQNKAAWVLFIVALLLFIAALCNSLGFAFIAMLMIALAMGAENSVLQSGGESVIGVTYMTGTLVKMGQRIAVALQGGDRWAWFPYLLLWFGLILGGITGAFFFLWYGVHALWFPAVYASFLTLLMARLIR